MIFADLDHVEARARACLDSGSGTIDPQTVMPRRAPLVSKVQLEDDGRMVLTLRHGAVVTIGAVFTFAEARELAGLLVPAPTAENQNLSGGYARGPIAPSLRLEFAEEPPCSCEQSQALEARVAGLEAEAKRQSAADKRLADWLRTVDAGSVLITKGGVSLCWHDHSFERREAHVADNALDPLDLGQRATLLDRVLDAAGAPKELT